MLDYIEISKYKKRFPITPQFSALIDENENNKSCTVKSCSTGIGNQVNMIHECGSTCTNSTYDYLIKLDRYIEYRKTHPKRYIQRKLYQKDIPFFSFLDIDHKSQIKNFQSFNYSNCLYLENSLSATETNVAQRICKGPSQQMKQSGFSQNNEIIAFDESTTPVGYTISTIPKLSQLNYNSNGKKIKSKGKLKRGAVMSAHYTSMSSQNNSVNSQQNCMFTQHLTFPSNSQIEKPKYEIKITSFEMDANDQNLINAFVKPDLKYLRNSEYIQTDDFLNLNINQASYTEVFDSNLISTFNREEEINSHFTADELKDDFSSRFNNLAIKKNANAQKEVDDNDYLIYMVEEHCFYRKLKNTNISTNDQNLNFPSTYSNIKPGSTTQLKPDIRDDSPKARVNILFLPIQIIENHII